jgi:D-aspartate ligase
LNRTKETPPAVVLGMEITGLAIARALGPEKIPVVGVDSVQHKTGSLSKYCRRIICPDPIKAEQAFLKSLLRLSDEFPGRAVIFPTNDEVVLCISRNRSVIKERYVLPFCENELIERINDKAQFYRLAVEHGIPVPRTYEAEDEDSLIRVSKNVRYPCIIKPKYGYLYKRFKKKAVGCNGEAELLKNFEWMQKISRDIMIQELVSGKDAQQFSLCSYMNRDFEPLGLFTARKTRQHPVEFGMGTLVESCDVPEIAELGISMLKRLKYWGMSEIEFKKDARDGKLKVLEINTRPWNHIGLAVKCGVNFPLIAYRDLLGWDVEKVTSFRKNVKWVWFASDLQTSFGKYGYRARGELGWRDWIRSFSGEKEYAIFSWGDLKPSVAWTMEDGMQLAKRFARRARNAMRWSPKDST